MIYKLVFWNEDINENEIESEEVMISCEESEIDTHKTVVEYLKHFKYYSYDEMEDHEIVSFFENLG